MGDVRGPSLMRPSGRQTGLVFCERMVPVSARPAVELFVAQTPGPAANPLLVIHGGPDWDHTYLREPLGQLAGRRRVILPDLRGCGRSTLGLPDGQYTPAAAAVWSDPVWSDPSRSGPELTRAAAVASAPADVWRPQARPGYLERLAGVRFTAEWLRPFRAGTLPDARPPDAARRLAALGLPILLLHGRQDMTFPARLAEDAAGLIPSARAAVIEAAGHMTHVDQPRAWLDALQDFLS
jgi:pimeloyl-ACP methyl ester carboxylesterase